MHVSASNKTYNTFYREYGTPVCNELLCNLEADALEHTKMLSKQGRRRTYAEISRHRTDGPLSVGAYRLGVCHDCLLTKPPTRRPVATS